MTNQKIEKTILDKIKEKKIKPKSKLYFISKNLYFWFLSFSFILIGGIAFASVLYKISGNLSLLNIAFKTRFDFTENIFYLIPYFWLIILTLFLIFALVNFRKTNCSYKYNLNTIFLSMLGAAGVLGILMFYLGFSQKTEEFSQKYIPFYDRYEKITSIKKEIFTRKIKDLGITKEVLDQNPELRKEIEEKFNRNVLGKIYIYEKPNECLVETFNCQNDQLFFRDENGCGCREIYMNVK